MIDRKRIRAVMLVACLDHLMPPIIRDELLSDAKLRSDFALPVDVSVKFLDVNVAFSRSKLFDAVRAAATKSGKPQKVTDRAGIEWEVTANTIKGNATLVIRSGQQILRADHLLLLTKSKKARKAYFTHGVERLNLTSALTESWAEVVDKRALSEEELDEVMREAVRTPVAVADRIAEHLRKGNISLDILVPRTLDYYEQLVGRVEGQTNIIKYAAEVAPEHIRRLLAWRTGDGLRLALLLGSHPLITDVIANEPISGNEFDELAKWAVLADPIARAVMLELSLRRPQDKNQISGSVHALAEAFCGKGEKQSFDSFKLLSAAFVMVEGELAKTRILDSKPTFWRRLATLAHAALITRCVISIEADLSSMVGWMGSVRGQEYTVRCFADLRSEPRWLPDYGTPQQLKNELGGRVLAAAATSDKVIDELGLRDMLISDGPQSLKRQINLPLIELPGPLEGNIDPIRQLSADQVERMRWSLTESPAAASSFAFMVNAGFVAKLPEDILNLAADAIRRAQYRLDSDGDTDKLRNCLLGLAVAAAANRNRQLADELFVVIRNYRRYLRDDLDLDAAFRIGIISCASRSNLAEWCKCVGGLIADFGFGELSREEAATLHPLVIDLCDLVPELWAACGQGIAAMEAVGFS
jgi:hypothetical protein